MDDEYTHNVVNHLEKYMWMVIATLTALRTSWSLLKRGISGYLPREC